MDAFHYLVTCVRHVLAPPMCLGCAAWLDDDKVLVCTACCTRVRPVVSASLAYKGASSMPVYAAGAYEDLLMRLVCAKYQRSIVAAHALGDLIAEYMRTQMVAPDMITAVPMHWSRYAWRGYNQSVEIARRVSLVTGIPYQRLVSKARWTRSQVACSPEERRKNMHDDTFVLCVSPETIENKRIVIIDDVMTTGATLQRVARVLAQHSPTSLAAMVGARAV